MYDIFDTFSDASLRVFDSVLDFGANLVPAILKDQTNNLLGFGFERGAVDPIIIPEARESVTKPGNLGTKDYLLIGAGVVALVLLVKK